MDLETRVCSRCGATADQVKIGLLVSEPQGWTTLTIGGLPITNRQLCPSCARDVRVFAATLPDELERVAEQKRQEVWRLGYEAGCDDTERSHVCVCPPAGWFVQQETKQLLYASTIDLADEPVIPLSEWIDRQNAQVPA